MKKPVSSPPRSVKTVPRPSGWVIGHERFAKISAVEGIALTPAMKARKSALDLAGASAAERREAITKVYKR